MPDQTTLDPALRYLTYLPSLPFDYKIIAWLARKAPARSPPPGVTREYLSIPVLQGGKTLEIPVCITRPANTSDPVPTLLWIHGGGMMVGSYKDSLARHDKYALEFGMCTVSVGYRLAPEHKAPAAVNDYFEVWKWMVANAESRAFDTKRLIVGGASAGGGIAAGTVQRIHDSSSSVQPCFQLLIYPMIDDRTVTRVAESDLYYIWSPYLNRLGWRSYLGFEPGSQDPAHQIPDYAVPARREDLRGLPPAWIGVGSLDLFHDEDVDYAKRLREQGVEVELKVAKGACHGSEMFVSGAAISVDFRQSEDTALKRAIGLA